MGRSLDFRIMESGKAEIWETRQGHVYMGAGRFANKHGVAKQLNSNINWTDSISDLSRQNGLQSNRETHEVLKKTIQIVGGDFNAEDPALVLNESVLAHIPSRRNSAQSTQ